MSETIWTEKYRPNTLDGYLGNEHFKKKLEQYINEQDFPHILLSGIHGVGKTTAAKIIAENVDCDLLYVNASDENSVDTVRNKIKGFASSMGFSPLKAVILDECLEENTLVWAQRGEEELLIPIKDLDQETDAVRTWNFEKDMYEWKLFEMKRTGQKELYRVSLANGETFFCSDTHRWYVETENGCLDLVRTTELHKYKYLRGPENIEILQVVKTDELGVTYDLSVADNNNFFIGQNETLTHNCDYLTPNAQAALRDMMETFSKKTRFILTCNYPERMIGPIVSRTQHFELTSPAKVEVAKHIAGILQSEEVEFEVADLKVIIDAYYPDIRKIINECHSASSNGKLIAQQKEIVASDFRMKILDIMSSNKSDNAKFSEVRQVVADARVRDFSGVYSYLYENVEKVSDSVSKSILALNEGQYRDSFVVDKEINFMATIINILS